MMSTDTLRSASVREPSRRTVAQLIAAAQRDTDSVSIFMDGCTAGDTEAAIFVVKGPEEIAYLRAVCERQGLLSSKTVVG
jgi:thiamine biosynthesis lipoprotein ApbE